MMFSTPSSSTALRRQLVRAAVGCGAVAALGLGLTACGSGTPAPDAPSTAAPTSASATPSATPTASGAAPASSGADCSTRAILAALPGGATMQRYDCARAGQTEWAAARVEPGPTVFFLRWDDGRWEAEESDDVCGTAFAGLPPALLDYCAPAAAPSTSPSARPTRTPSPRPTTAPSTPVRPAAAECTSRAILDALPGGATMQRFSCAEVGGTEWAAARVEPGSTTFFLQWRDGRWQAEQSADVCGTASAGLPASLERYCS